MNLKEIGNIFGLIIGLAIVSVIAARPEFLRVTFSGGAGLIRAATEPVTIGERGKARRR